MAESISERAKRAFNVFMSREPYMYPYGTGPSYTQRPDRQRLKPGNERSIISSIITRIALDVSTAKIQHVRVDQDGRYIETIDSGLNECLNVSANIDQTGKAFLQDLTMSLLDDGCIAVVPVDTVSRPKIDETYDIRSLRVGQVVQWWPRDVRLKVYNDRSGNKEEITLDKRKTGIIENPLYAVMNEPNSTLQRLIRKLNLLDNLDEQSSSDKLDLIIQLPYVIKSEMRRSQAEKRRQDIENQLAGSKYGIAYTDGTERITQLNRAVENNLMPQVEYLTTMLQNQLGLSASVFDGTATDEVMANYYSRTINPILTAIVNELARKFISFDDRKDGQTIMFFRSPFDMIPISKIPEMADKLTRNEIMTSNEVRQVIGLRASTDPRADELLNKNMNAKVEPGAEGDETSKPEGIDQNGGKA